MLQRIQTIWMLLAVLCAVALFVTSQDVEIVSGFPVLNIATVILILIGGLGIFSYNNRKRQILLNTIGMLINALLIGLLSFWLLNLSGGISIPEKGIELIFPILAITCLLIANVFIRKDEKLVKSVDRLR
jgi:peptidoglycan/LPS O-acetylase OafA/YrhL